MAPANTPAAIIERLNKEIVAVIRAPESAAALAKAGAEPLSSTPAELAAMIREGIPKYVKVVQTAGIKPE